MDSSGNLVNGYVYDPFGNLFEQNETVANPWQYASGYLDSTTGLYHFGARYYDPTLGRWTQEDPLPGQLNNPDSLNPYLYVTDNPVNGTDTSGKDCLWAIVSFLSTAAWLGYIGWQGALLIAGLAEVIDPIAAFVLLYFYIILAFPAYVAILIDGYNSSVAPACGWSPIQEG